jgi:hypothetical protein
LLKTFAFPFLLLVLTTTNSHAQIRPPRLGFGAGLGTKGVVGTAEFRVLGPLWLGGRFTANTTLVQHAGGARVEIIPGKENAAYAQALVGQAWCYYELSGAAGFCDAPKVKRTGLTVSGGFEFATTRSDSWRIAIEAGVWRGFRSDAVSSDLEHWFGAALIKRRLRLRSPN